MQLKESKKYGYHLETENRCQLALASRYLKHSWMVMETNWSQLSKTQSKNSMKLRLNSNDKSWNSLYNNNKQNIILTPVSLNLNLHQTMT